jgi:flagellar motility protein MotE (MotC chaperone)
MNRKASNRPKGGVLTVISLLMVGSAAIRVGLEAGPALAKAAEPPVTAAKPIMDDHPKTQELLTALLRREQALKEREAAILEKEKALEIADQAIETRLVALQDAETSLRETLSYAQKAAETDLTRLTDVYQSMKPKDAAALFETMDPGFAAGFLSRMPPDAAAGVLAGLSPEAAYTISVIMAGRNAAAPQE